MVMSRHLEHYLIEVNYTAGENTFIIPSFQASTHRHAVYNSDLWAY